MTPLTDMRAIVAAKATREWVRGFVCALSLCPWAAPAQTLVTVSPPVASLPAHVVYMRRQAELLLAGARPHARSAKPTVVCAFPCDEYAEVGAFAALWNAVQTDLDRHAPGALVLLAFHPRRVDSGPGCIPDDADDAGHFTVRSPYPTLQLLRSVDVDDARAEWAQRRGGPGAWGLLVANKERLRALGSAELAARIDLCRQPTRGDLEAGR